MASNSEKKLRNKMHFLVNTWEELEVELANAEKVLSDAHLQPPPSPSNKRRRRRARETNSDGNLIPTNSTTSFEEIIFWRDRALDKVEGLRSAISDRELTVELVLVWGAFQFASAMLLSALLVSKEDEGRKRAGEAGGKKVERVVEKKWVARELKPIIAELELQPKLAADTKLLRHQAEERLAHRIQAELKTSGDMDSDRRRFLKSLLTKEGVLRHSYIKSRFADTTVAKLASGDMADVPAPLAPTR